MKKKITRFAYSIVIAIITISFLLVYPTQVNAANDSNNISISTNEDNKGEILGYLGGTQQTRITSSDVVYHIMNKSFYIKNAYSGQYLDVCNGVASNYTNVWQYPFNGTASQRWYINYNGDATFSFYSELGNNMVLDINNGDPNNEANVQIYENNGTDSQKFNIGYTDSSTYVIITKVSDFKKSISTSNSGCSVGENVHQYDYAGLWSERWILEPVEKDVDLGALYAFDNYNNTVQAYPRLENSFGGDCTNFVSQCMLASGIHFRDNWQILRKNGNYTNITTTSQLNNSWSLSDPSPWISAVEFQNYWVSHVSNGAYKATGQEILDNPNIAWNTPVTQGCVVQLAKKTLTGGVGEAHHSMYISGYINDGTYNTYGLTYHSTDTLFTSLLDVCRRYPNEYFLFYTF